MEETFTSQPKKSLASFGSTIWLRLAFVLVAIGLVTGCGKHKTPVVQTAPDQNTNQTADQAVVYQQSPAAAPGTVTAPPTAAPDLKEINRSVLRWILGNRRRPQSFEDFAATAGVTIPPPPAGKKYILSKDMHVLLIAR